MIIVVVVIYMHIISIDGLMNTCSALNVKIVVKMVRGTPL